MSAEHFIILALGWINALAAIVALLCANDALRNNMRAGGLIMGFCTSATIAALSIAIVFLTP